MFAYKDVFNQGYDAYEGKKNIYSNPYNKKKQSKEFYAWKEGWIAAQELDWSNLDMSTNINL